MAALSLDRKAAAAFPEMLGEFRLGRKRSRNSLAHEVGIDPSYLTRIERGDREPPRLYILEGLMRALHLSLFDRNRLMVAAGYAPLSLIRIGPWDEALQAVTDVLSDYRLSEAERDEFRQLIQLAASHWRAPRTGPELIG